MQANQWLMSAIFGLWAIAACGGSDAEPGGGSAAPDGPTADGPFTPFIVSNLNPDPIPVRGSDGKIHVSYELMVINSAPRDATVTRIETLAEGRKSKKKKSIHGKTPSESWPPWKETRSSRDRCWSATTSCRRFRPQPCRPAGR